MPSRPFLNACLLVVLTVACTRAEPPAATARIRPATSQTAPQTAAPPAPLSGTPVPAAPLAVPPRDVLRLPWGDAPGQVGHRRGEEGMPEGPMALDVAPDGRIAVLDQVNSRVQVFTPGQPAPQILPLPRATFQDVAWGDDGRLFALDRLGPEPMVQTLTGKPMQVALAGDLLSEGAAATAIFPGADGLWVEVEHGKLVRLTDAEDRPLTQQVHLPGRFVHDGQFLLTAVVAGKDQVAVTARLSSDTVAFRRVLTFPMRILGLRELGGNKDGRTVVVAHLAQEQGDVTVAQKLTAVVLAPDGTELRRTELPPPTEPDEQFRPVRLAPDGALYLLQCRADGAAVVKVVP